MSLASLWSYCRWRLYRWPLAPVGLAVLVACTAFWRLEHYTADGHRRIAKLRSVKPYEDVRWKDLSGLDLASATGIVESLWFNGTTRWPANEKLRGSADPAMVLSNAMNPGLGVRALHKQGIVGKGVNVAIIDQPLTDVHSDYRGKIAAYRDFGCNSESSMHGPAVASLLVGEHCGTAPGARIYYAAAPSWTGDAKHYADALDWILEQNSALARSNRIRVVSVSAAPSGPGSPFTKNLDEWDLACKRAETAGILVLDCTVQRGVIGPSYFDPRNRENSAGCQLGFPGQAKRPGPVPGRRLLVPTSPRTTAEHYANQEPGYQYMGRGGLSWAIPYCAGVLAMGWQLHPEGTGPEMLELLFDTAFHPRSDLYSIDPSAFIDRLTQKDGGR